MFPHEPLPLPLNSPSIEAQEEGLHPKLSLLTSIGMLRKSSLPMVEPIRNTLCYTGSLN